MSCNKLITGAAVVQKAYLTAAQQDLVDAVVIFGTIYFPASYILLLLLRFLDPISFHGIFEANLGPRILFRQRRSTA